MPPERAGPSWGWAPAQALRPGVEPAGLQRWAAQRARGAEPWLHAEAARRMAERLSLLRAVPERLLDVSAAPPGQGASTALLAAHYPAAQQTCAPDWGSGFGDAVRAQAWQIDAAPPSASAAQAAASTQPAAAPRSWWQSLRSALVGAPGAAADALPMPVPQGPTATEVQPAHYGLLWSVLGLHAVADPQATLRQWARALAPGGVLMFVALGAATTPELRSVYREAGWGPPAAPLVDLHDLGDWMVEAGLADPVVDAERLTLEWPDVGAALAELRTLGRNVADTRMPGLRGRSWRHALEHALQSADGGCRLQFELVYGHAFKPETARALGAGEARIDLSDLRASLPRHR